MIREHLFESHHCILPGALLRFGRQISAIRSFPHREAVIHLSSSGVA
jgi:hypothetical protein